MSCLVLGRVGGRVGRFVVVSLDGAFRFDGGNQAVAVVLVGDDLGASVGKLDAVRSGHDFPVSGLLVAKVVVRWSVVDVIAEGVGLSGLESTESKSVSNTFELSTISDAYVIVGRGGLVRRRSGRRQSDDCEHDPELRLAGTNTETEIIIIDGVHLPSCLDGGIAGGRKGTGAPTIWGPVLFIPSNRPRARINV